MSEKKQNEIKDEKIEGQIDISEQEIESKVEEPKMSDTDVTELETPGEITSCADHISRTKILDVIESTMAKYQGKVVLAMSEVRDIIKAITTAINE